MSADETGSFVTRVCNLVTDQVYSVCTHTPIAPDALKCPVSSLVAGLRAFAFLDHSSCVRPWLRNSARCC